MIKNREEWIKSTELNPKTRWLYNKIKTDPGAMEARYQEYLKWCKANIEPAVQKIYEKFADDSHAKKMNNLEATKTYYEVRAQIKDPNYTEGYFVKDGLNVTLGTYLTYLDELHFIPADVPYKTFKKQLKESYIKACEYLQSSPTFGLF